MIEPKRDVEINLLRWAWVVQSARIEKLTRTGVFFGVVADVLQEQACLFGHFLFSPNRRAVPMTMAFAGKAARRDQLC
jgi:hypothetical protein